MRTSWCARRKTDRDITAWVLAQIVAEEAGKGNNLLPLGYLRRLLHFYHEGLGDHLSAYLESSMELFAENQRDLLRHLSNPFDPVGALATFRELGERNAEYFTRLVQSASGGRGPGTVSSEAGEPEPPAAERNAAPASRAEDGIQALRGAAPRHPAPPRRHRTATRRLIRQRRRPATGSQDAEPEAAAE